jgi:uncharacterized protein (DUF2384 family)
MTDSVAPSDCTYLMRQRLDRKVDGVVAAFDRDFARRGAMRAKLRELDAEVLLAAIDCLGSAEKAALWLTSPEVGLSEENPIEVAATSDGKERVLRLLWRLGRGMYACGSD